MKRLLIVYNPCSSRFLDVKKEVLSRAGELKGYVIGKYEVEKTDVDKNAAKLAKILSDGDLVIAAGGDATGVIAVNAILKSEKDVTLGVLPYGNFNDLARTLGTKTLDDIICRTGPVQDFYPLEILVDGKFFRYATCYVTIGMMAEAVKLYDGPKMRKILKSGIGRFVGSYTNLAIWYFKNRRKKQFIPEFKLNGKLQPAKISDYIAVNGGSMARVMKGGEDYKKPKVFQNKVDRLTSFLRLCCFMARSIFVRVPGNETSGDELEFINPASVEIQAEGEYKRFEKVSKIEIRKSGRYLKVIKV